MSLPQLLWQSLRLTPGVLGRFLLVFVILAMLAVAAVFSVSDPIGQAFIAFLILVLGGPFLFVVGIRAGLVGLDATDPPTPSGLMAATLKMLFFHFLLGSILTSLMISGAFVLMRYVIVPQSLVESFFAYLADPTVNADDLQQALALYLPMFMFFSSVASSITYGIFGVPMAATAANAVARSPNYDLIYGMGRHFLPIFVLSFLAMGAPSILIGLVGPTFAMNTLDVGPDALIAHVGVMQYLNLVVALLGPCVVMAGLAVAFVDTLDEVEAEKEAEQPPPVDIEEERVSLRALRQERTGAASLSSVYIPDRFRDSNDDPKTDGSP